MACRAALVKARGHKREAAKLLGIDHTTLDKILKRDNAIIDRRAAAERWQPSPEWPSESAEREALAAAAAQAPPAIPRAYDPQVLALFFYPPPPAKPLGPGCP